MAISSDYPKPITVNGYACRNCDDVSKAKKFQDPAGPKLTEASPVRDTAVSFGGALANRNGVSAANGAQSMRQTLDRYA